MYDSSMLKLYGQCCSKKLEILKCERKQIMYTENIWGQSKENVFSGWRIVNKTGFVLIFNKIIFQKIEQAK